MEEHWHCAALACANLVEMVHCVLYQFKLPSGLQMQLHIEHIIALRL